MLAKQYYFIDKRQIQWNVAVKCQVLCMLFVNVDCEIVQYLYVIFILLSRLYKKIHVTYADYRFVNAMQS